MSTHQLLSLITETSLHAGAGGSQGYIDLPIQREAHTDWPCVFGSSLKGALRAAATLNAGQAINDVLWLFGPESAVAPAPGLDTAGAGALVVTDARLALLPVRSLTGHYKWVTCPAVLKRLKSDLLRLKLPLPSDTPWPELPNPKVEEVCVHGVRVANPPKTLLYLDELAFSSQAQDMSHLCRALSHALGITKDDLEQRLAIVDDTRFAHLARYATPVVTHVKLDERKRVVKGQLWTEESLPPDTVLYSMVFLAARGQIPAQATLQKLTALSFPEGYLQIGANETVGMGFVRVQSCISR